MKSKFIPDEIKYTGAQLRSQWSYKNFNLLGDSIVAFIGACDVSLENMVDLEDVKSESKIYSERMLHFIVEHFELDLEKGILRQRLLIAIIGDEVNARIKRQVVRRKGDDLFDGDKKLSVSIATLSPVSTMIHAGINISSQNTPVKTIGLEDYRIDPIDFAKRVMKLYIEELESAAVARWKVRTVD
jgi:hypothetical protein